MESLIILFLTLLATLFFRILLGSVIIPWILSNIISSSKSSALVLLQKELEDGYITLRGISAMDEFARWAKTKRHCASLQQKLNQARHEWETEKLEKGSKISFLIKTAGWVSEFLLLLFLTVPSLPLQGKVANFKHLSLFIGGRPTLPWSCLYMLTAALWTL